MFPYTLGLNVYVVHKLRAGNCWFSTLVFLIPRDKRPQSMDTKIVFVTASPFIRHGRWDLPSMVCLVHVPNFRIINKRLRQKLHKLTWWNFTSLVCLLSRENSILSVVQNIIRLQKRQGITPFLDQTADTGLVTRSLIFKRTVKGNVIITPILKMKKLRICKRWSSQDQETENGWKEGKYLNRRILERNVAIQSKQCPDWNVVTFS